MHVNRRAKMQRRRLWIFACAVQIIVIQSISSIHPAWSSPPTTAARRPPPVVATTHATPLFPPQKQALPPSPSTLLSKITICDEQTGVCPLQANITELADRQTSLTPPPYRTFEWFLCFAEISKKSETGRCIAPLLSKRWH